MIDVNFENEFRVKNDFQIFELFQKTNFEIW